jgi:hypothetical protein
MLLIKQSVLYMSKYYCHDTACCHYFREPHEVATWVINARKPFKIEYQNDDGMTLEWRRYSIEELLEFKKYCSETCLPDDITEPLWIKIYDESKDNCDNIMTDRDMANMFI